MKKFLFALTITLTLAAAVTVRQYFAVINRVDAANGKVEYVIAQGKKKDGVIITAIVIKDCVIKEGYYRLGKPATTTEGNAIENGLRNPIFQKATAENPVRVNIYIADEDDQARGIKKGEVTKILVNPPPNIKKGN